MEPLEKRKISNFKKLMAEAGILKIGARTYPCIQILSVIVSAGNTGWQAI